MSHEIVIETLGSRGDGVAQHDENLVYIPFTLPGERVRVNMEGARGDVLEILKASEQRCEPVCRHFGTCGGCSLQHLNPTPYLDWKREQIRQAFLSRGLDVPVKPVILAKTGTSNRAEAASYATRQGLASP